MVTLDGTTPVTLQPLDEELLDIASLLRGSS